VPAHQELALHDSDDEEPVVTEAEPELEALADTMEPDAESVGPALPEVETPESAVAVAEEAGEAESAPAGAGAEDEVPAEEQS
jgi:hypothetical protein